MRTRMYYVDDSGAGETGYAVFSWITCDTTAWTSGLAVWHDFRRRLFSECGIPPEYELHAGVFITGRGRPSEIAAWNLHKSNRAAVAELALQTIGACPALSVGTVYRRFDKPSQFGVARSGLYRRLIEHLDRRLAADDHLGLVFVDGDGTDPAYTAAHRALGLRTRHIVEDPVFRISHRSQWIQMADLVAYVAYQSLLRAPSRRFLWPWYDRYLCSDDAAGGPIEL